MDASARDEIELYVLKQTDIYAHIASLLNIETTVDFDDRGQSEEFHQAYYKDSLSYKILYDLFSDILMWSEKNKRRKTVLYCVEPNYVDAVYRDSYYLYFAGKHFSYSRFCKRLLIFFDGFANREKQEFFDLPSARLNKEFIGSVVLRPIPGSEIGTTILNPYYFIKDPKQSFFRLADYHITAFGKRLSTKAFPFSVQDSETTTCAEVTILNLTDYYSRSFQEYKKVLPSNIHEVVEEEGFERTLPAKGLKYETISKVLIKAGFSPRIYNWNGFRREQGDLKRILYHYIESGIPVSIGIQVGDSNPVFHSMIIMGHGMVNRNPAKRSIARIPTKEPGTSLWIEDSSGYVDEFYFSDDERKPYTLGTITVDSETDRLTVKYNGEEKKYAVMLLMIPLYKKMYLDAFDAQGIFFKILANQIDTIRKSASENSLACNIGTKDNPLQTRIFMASARGFLKWRDNDFVSSGNSELALWYRTMIFPRFVWVCEILDSSAENAKVIGEIILDATAANQNPNEINHVIILHYPGYIHCRTPKDSEGHKSNDSMILDLVSKEVLNAKNIKELSKVKEYLESVRRNNDDAVIFKINNWKGFSSYRSNLENPQCNMTAYKKNKK